MMYIIETPSQKMFLDHAQYAQLRTKKNRAHGIFNNTTLSNREAIIMIAGILQIPASDVGWLLMLNTTHIDTVVL